MTDDDITKIADKCGMYECHDNGRINGNTVLDFARAIIAAQLAAPVAAQPAQGERHKVPCTSQAGAICPQPAYCHAVGCKVAQGARQPEWYPLSGCNDRAACREAGFCMDGPLCPSRA
jgi:hypothetical protein